VSHKLHSIAYPKERNAELEQLPAHPGRIFLSNPRRAAREDYPPGLELPDLIDRDRTGKYL